MSEVTVKQLADTVGAPVDRLLKQMQEAGLAHENDQSAVTEEEKQTLLAYLKRSHGSDDRTPKKITLKRKTVGKLKTGQGRGSRTVNVEVRRKRTYVKREDAQAEESAPAAAASRPGQAELEAQRIRAEDLARQTAEEETRRPLHDGQLWICNSKSLQKFQCAKLESQPVEAFEGDTDSERLWTRSQSGCFGTFQSRRDSDLCREEF